VTRITKKKDLDSLDKKVRFLRTYNTGGYVNEMCKVKQEIDCNKNSIADYCEIEKDSLGNICNRQGTVIMTTGAKKCKMNGISDKEFCKRFKNSDVKDCNSNGILDECEINSKSDLSCESSLCIGKFSVERTPLNCLNCKSEDLNFNGIPDICETEVGKGHSSKILDCNGNGIDDYADLLLKYSDDKNSNGIPDECEIGSCCSYGECYETSLPKCEIEEFKRNVPCSERKDCFKISELDKPGSCCRRTDSIDTFMYCEDGVSFLDCESMQGRFSKTSCGKNKCRNSIGNCCSNKFKLNTQCVESVTWSLCSEYYENFIFDFKNCEDPLNLCKANETTIGTCTLNGNCIKEINKEDCLQLNGFFDTLPCRYRKDLHIKDIGSCCSKDSKNFECTNLISDRECLSKNGSFSRETCEERRYCLPEDEIPSCCFKKSTSECYEISDPKCDNSEMEKIFCQSHPICEIRSKVSSGCCLIKDEDMIDLKMNDCLYFGGFWMDSTQCFNEKLMRKFPETILEFPHNIILQNQSANLKYDIGTENEIDINFYGNSYGDKKNAIKSNNLRNGLNTDNSKIQTYAIIMVVSTVLFFLSVLVTVILVLRRKNEVDKKN
jgi:hypothetical protein